MYSDLLESPSEDCFSFSDQSLIYNMAEMNEITNQTNMDYIFDSYYSSRVSRFDSGFELPEDCKNMSFSELFDQELFSTQENKDCKLTIKIEEEVKEDTLKTCFSVDDSHDTSFNNLVNIKENVPLSSSLSKSYVPKKGINRTYIKSTNNSNVTHLMNNLFGENEDLGANQISMTEIPVIKQEPQDDHDDMIEQNTSKETKQLFSADFQNTIDNYSFVKIENLDSSSSRSSTPKFRGINRTSIKTITGNGINNLLCDSFCESKDPAFDQTSSKDKIPILKNNPEDIQINQQNIAGLQLKPCFTTDLHYSNYKDHCMVKINDNVLSSFFENSHLNNHGINKMSKNVDTKNFIYRSFSKNNNLGVKEVPVTVKICKEDLGNAETITCYSGDDSICTVDCNRFVKIEDDFLFSLSNNKISKNQGINQTSVNTNKMILKPLVKKLLCEPTFVDIDQTLAKVKTSLAKSKSKDNNKTIKKNSTSKDSELCFSVDNLSNKSLNNLKRSIPSPKDLISKKRINTTSLKNTQNLNSKKLIGNYSSEKKNSSMDLTVVKEENLSSDSENNFVNSGIDQNSKIEIISSSIDNLQSTTNSEKLFKIEDSVISSLPKSSISKCGINKTKATKNHIKNVKHNSNSKSVNLSNTQTEVNIEVPNIKQEPRDIYDVYDSQNATYGHGAAKIKDDFMSALSKSLTSKHQSIKKPVIKITGNHDKPSKLNNLDQTSVNVKTLVIKQEPRDESFVLENDVVNVMRSVDKESKHNNSNSYQSNNLKQLNNKNQEYASIKIENIPSNEISFKIDITDSQTCSVETEKKKITWEEFRAKRGKMGLFNDSGIHEKPSKDDSVTEDNKIEAIIQEFDRNTAVHIIGEKRKIEDLDEKHTSAKEIENKKDLDLQNKRMKIEYIKKLLPSSFASEIAKTSSLMKGIISEDNENDSTSDESVISNDKSHRKYIDTHDDLGYLNKNDRSHKKSHQSRAHSSYRSLSRPDYSIKNNRSSSTSSNSDDYFNRSRIDCPQGGQYDQNARNPVQRPKDQKRVVYVGQIPIRYGKRYLQNRFMEFGSIQSLSLHKKPDFRVYYAFVTYSDKKEAERAINHGNDDTTQVQLDIRFGERKQTLTPYYDLDDEWLTDWYGYNQPVAVVKPPPSPEKVSFEEELQEFHKLAQIKKLNQKSSQVS